MNERTLVAVGVVCVQAGGDAAAVKGYQKRLSACVEKSVSKLLDASEAEVDAAGFFGRQASGGQMSGKRVLPWCI